MIITEDQYRVCRQHTRNEYARITIINNQDLEIAQLQGKVVDGTINIDNSSYLMRTATLKLILDDTTLPNNQNGYIWTNKKMKIEIGIYDILTGSIVWFNQGIYLYKNTQINYSATTKELSINLLDKMSQFSGDLGGVFENDVLITNKGTPISDAIRSIVTGLGGENNVMIDNIVDDSGNVLTVPYSIIAKSGDKMLDTLKILVELYKYYVIRYDANGTFICEHTKTLLSDTISENFKDVDYTINSQITNNFDYIKNFVKVYGISVQPMVAVQDIQLVDNPNPINGTTSVRITFNKPLYNSNGNRIADGTDVTNYFQYNGTVSNFTKAVYSSSTWQVIFTINGENGKIISPKPNMIFDSTQLPFSASSFVFSSKNSCWEQLLQGSVITDGINNQTKFELHFNKALYDKNGNPIVSGVSLKSAFTYSDGSGSSTNFLDGIYTIDSGDYYITLTFSNAIANMTVEINKDGVNSSSSIYDSAGIIYQPTYYIMDGNTWTLEYNPDNLLTYQITAEASNTDDVNSPYSINNIGKRTLVINDQNIYNKTQASLRAQWELQTHSNLNEKITIVCLSLLYLDVNQIIYLFNEELGIDGKYRLDKISFSLREGTMNIECSKLYM